MLEGFSYGLEILLGLELVSGIGLLGEVTDEGYAGDIALHGVVDYAHDHCLHCGHGLLRVLVDDHTAGLVFDGCCKAGSQQVLKTFHITVSLVSS